MRILPSFAVVASSFLVYACSSVPAPASDPAPDVANLERLLYAQSDSGGLRVRAASRGCTSEDSFDVAVDRARGEAGSLYQVSLSRKAPETCDGDLVANGVALFFTRGELGLPPGAQISVRNPVGVN